MKLTSTNTRSYVLYPTILAESYHGYRILMRLHVTGLYCHQDGSCLRCEEWLKDVLKVGTGASACEGQHVGGSENIRLGISLSNIGDDYKISRHS